MITIYIFDEIGEINTISETFKEEIRRYFQEIAEGIVGEEWKSYNLEEVGPILVVEEEDTIDVLDEYGLMQGSKTIPISLPEFALNEKIASSTLGPRKNPRGHVQLSWTILADESSAKVIVKEPFSYPLCI